jgi:hypothetical protein
MTKLRLDLLKVCSVTLTLSLYDNLRLISFDDVIQYV